MKGRKIFQFAGAIREVSHKLILIFWIIAILSTVSVDGLADVNRLASPSHFIYPKRTIDFEDGSDLDFVNTHYLSSGVTFSRDDGYPIFFYDWGSKITTSPPMVLATIGSPTLPAPEWSTHLNVSFSDSIYEIGAFFGNDLGSGSGFTKMTLSVFDDSHMLLGSVLVNTNNNEKVDQFIGLRSSTPLSYARFQVDGEFCAVVIDDLIFAVPEPATILLFTLACPCIRLTGGGLALRRKR